MEIVVICTISLLIMQKYLLKTLCKKIYNLGLQMDVQNRLTKRTEAVRHTSGVKVIHALNFYSSNGRVLIKEARRRRLEVYPISQNPALNPDHQITAGALEQQPERPLFALL